MIEDFFSFLSPLLLIVIPIYISNGTALLFGGGKALDFNKNFFDSRPIFGPGKTFKGTFAGIFFGTIGGILVSFLFPEFSSLLGVNYIIFAFLLASGAMIGDITSSFAKRRLGKERGSKSRLLDRLDFLIGGLILGAVFFIPSIEQLIILGILTFVIHKIGNVLAFKTKLKKVPW